jgi:hypothetical protein
VHAERSRQLLLPPANAAFCDEDDGITTSAVAALSLARTNAGARQRSTGAAGAPACSPKEKRSADLIDMEGVP